MFYYSIVSSHRAVIADYKVTRAELTPAQIDTYVIHNTKGLYYKCGKYKVADQLRGYRITDLHLCFLKKLAK